MIREWPATTPAFSMIFLALAAGELMFCTYMSDRHEELDWVGGGVIQLSAFAGVFLFILGFAFAVRSATRGRERGTVRLLDALPLILYLVSVTWLVVRSSVG